MNTSTLPTPKRRARLAHAIAALPWLILTSLAHPALAQSINVVLPAAKDNTLFEALGDKSDGAGEYFFAGNNDNSEARRGVIAFDLSSIPAGSTIDAVTLTLRMMRTKAGAETVSLHRLTADWGEGTSVAGGNGGGDPAPATDGDATWTIRFYDTAAPGSSPTWASPGGDYDGTASASLSVGGNGSYSWSSPQMVVDVQNWIDGVNGNFGWIAIGNEGAGQTAKRFNSRENTQSPPELEIDYTPPSDTGACCAEDGSCTDVAGTACTGGSVFLGSAFACTPSNPCAAGTGRCCDDVGGCTLVADPGGSCTGTYTQGGVCDPNTCPVLTGACCAANAAADCTVETEASCAGTFQGALTTCSPNPCPVVLTPFVDALPLPAPATPVSGSPGDVAEYHIAMREVQQQLHSELPPTTVWGYGDGLSGATYPGPTIEARTGLPVTVQWINDLRDTSVGGEPLRTSHYLHVDTCPHGADDQSPRTVVHLHGGHIPSEYDGYPEATFLPGNGATYVYPNNQPASTLWYHDHALGITRLNVQMGLAGFYLVRDAAEDALACPMTPPTPCLPSGSHEVPLVIQDRTFNPDGSIQYPFDWQADFLGDTLLVNGKVWPYLEVEQGKYRFRVLNGSNSRTYTLALSTGAPFHVIGLEGGLLASPVMVSEVTIGPGERAELVVDFSPYADGTNVVLENSAPAPFPGSPGVGVIPEVMQFRVVAGGTPVTNPIPDPLRTIETLDEGDAVVSRTLELKRNNTDPCSNDGTRWEVISTDGLNGAELGHLWDDVTEFPELGTTEIWSFINRSGIMHPMHMHLVFFQVLDRETFSVVGSDIVPSGVKVPPGPEEAGWKDTVKVGANEIVRVIARFEDYTGVYPYHCHILEHEDHEMMRQFQTVSCGNDVPEPTEECDDGNVEVGDGCTPDCEVEDYLVLYGSAEGGSVSLLVDGEPISVPTGPPDDAFSVAIAIADAINADPTLAAAGVTAFADGTRVVTNGTITNVVVTDPGLGVSVSIPGITAWGTALLGALVLAAGIAAARRGRLRAG